MFVGDTYNETGFCQNVGAEPKLIVSAVQTLERQKELNAALNTYAVHTFEKQKSVGNCSITHHVSNSAKDQLKVISNAKTHHRPEMRGIYNCSRFTKFSKLLLEILI